MIASSRRLSLLTLSTLCVVSLPGAVQAQAKAFEYSPSTGQYRFTSDTKTNQSVMGNTTDITSTAGRLLTIAIARLTADTLAVTLTVDSMSASNSAGMPTMGIEKMPGTKFTAKVAPNGSFYSATGPSEAENALGAGMTDEVARALPRIRASLANGVTWTDTLKDKVKQRTIELEREIITKFTVAGDSVVAGESTWRILREATTKATGSGTMQGTPVTVESTGSVKGVLWVSKKGVLMGARGEETASNTINVPAMGGQVLVTNNTTSLVTKVK